MIGSRHRTALLLLTLAGGALVGSGTASAACAARPLVLLHASGSSARTVVKLPPFLRATLICGGDRGLRGLRGEAGKRGLGGAIGVAGPAGASGAQGVMGPVGATGDTGRTGAVGPTGPTGPTGDRGADGQIGADGPPGPDGTPAAVGYGYIYNTGSQSVAIESDIVFSTNGSLAGITHTPGTPGVTLTNAGIYKLEFSVTAATANQFAVFMNGVAVSGGTYGSAAGNQQNDGQLIVSGAAGDVLTIRNHTSAAAINLDNVAGGSAVVPVDASILIERLA